MRILLVDNYDSFTYNLFHYLAEAGAEPVVIRNDEPGWTEGPLAARLAGFDGVVLSPGPGTPARAADFGICRRLVRECELPILGICLGHQGIGWEFGATVGRAPEPRHGRTSAVRHDGTGLFAGLPSPLEVVRYHSLAVTDLPEEIEATAWSSDGVLMGLRHRDRPLWGVQFHPESVSTSHGHQLLANFLRLAAEHRPRREPAAPVPAPVAGTGPGAPGVAAAPSGPVRRLRVLAGALPTRWDDELVFDHLFRGGNHAFWLDSSARDTARGRFSILGDACGPLARVARADAWNDTVTVEQGGRTTTVAGEFLPWLDQDLRSCRTELPDLPFDFALGWVGYLGYELKSQTGGDRVHRAEEDDAVLVFADRAVVLDHATATSHLLALVEDGDGGASEAAARQWLADAARQLGTLAGRTAEDPPVGREPQLDGLRLRHDREAYLDLIGACQQEIAAGETYEVCLTNELTASGTFDTWQAYRRLRRASPAPFAALLQFGRTTVLSTSPERFLRIGRDGVAESRPIKGTRPRGATPAEDEALRLELAASEKDRSENLMIVDLVRNDLGRCAEVGSVEASEIFQVETFARAHQLVSTVRARLRGDASAVDCVRAAFPGGSMTGAPKRRTMQLIDRLEAGPRGVYSGAVGYFSLSGAADLSIVIRTLVAGPEPGRVRYGVGGAVVALSDPDEEFEETAVKAAPLLGLCADGFPGRVPARPALDARPVPEPRPALAGRPAEPSR
ncbi:aminodeoxychorismate synthase component I [Kitasatospora indigofera]|uniref:aminodeoxychorismate synthase component I n=1 Tax=Kitasatospora indigofera TaxID=67307 RepID=UPI00362A12CD